MPVCRYMFEDEFNAIYHSMDADLRELCDEIRELTGERYVVENRSYQVKAGWWPFEKLKTVEYYTVLIRTFEHEVQCINLLSGLGGGYTRNEAGAFLVGVRSEAMKAMRNCDNCTKPCMRGPVETELTVLDRRDACRASGWSNWQRKQNKTD